MEDRTCIACGVSISEMHPRARYCSTGCKWIARPRVPCSACGQPSGHGLNAAGVDPGLVVCRDCRSASKPRRPERCEHCDGSFDSRWRSAGAWTRFCSKSCARKAQLADGSHSWMKSSDWSPALTDDERKARRSRQGELATRKRRARLAGVEREPYSLAEIAERDGFRCGICGRQVNMTLKYPHPRSASVDHIIPLSHPDGTDTRVNVRLAHLGENVARGNRAGWEQQLLIG